MIKAFGGKMKIALEHSKSDLPLDDVKVEIDGYGIDGNRILLVEAFARIKKLLSGQKRKILTDAFKLIFIADRLKAKHPPSAKIEAHLVFLSAAARDSVVRVNWPSAALKHFGIVTHVVRVSRAVKDRVRKAEANQAKNQAGRRK